MTFAKGTSGNPAGRKKGTLNPSTKLRRAIEGKLPGIVEKLIEAAEGGDVAAASLLFSRALPALKPVDTPITTIAMPTDLGAAAVAVLSGIASGTLSPDQAASLAAVLASLGRAKEAADLERRITDLEAVIERPNPPHQ